MALCGHGLSQERPNARQEPESPASIHEKLVVTAQMAPETARDSLYRVRVLDQQRIQGQAAGTLRELLSHELNIELTQHSVFGSGLSMGGISGENVKILQDGVPVIGRLNGIIDLDHLALAGVGRVEIVEGPTSVYHGTDALAGVVNLISRDPRADGFQGYLEPYYRSVGERTLQGGVELGGNRQGFRMDGLERRFDGFSNGEGRELDWARRRQDQLSLRHTIQWRALRFSQGIRYFQEQLRDPGSATGGLARDIAYRTRRAGYDVSSKGFLGENLYLDAQLSFSNYHRDQRISVFDAVSGAAGPEGPAQSATDFGLWLGRVALSHKDILPKVSLQMGIELSREKGTGGRLLHNDQRSRDQALFTNLRWSPMARFHVQPAFRYSRNSSFGGLFTPALHIKVNARKNLDLRASYARGYRGPSLKETYLDFTMAAGPYIYHIAGNPELEPERGQRLQVSLESRHRLMGNTKITAQADLYHNRVDDLIALGDLLPTPGTPNRLERHYINLASHRTRGAGLGVSLGRPRWNASIKLSRTEIANQLAPKAIVPGFSGSYDGVFRTTLRTAGGQTSFHLFYKYQGARPGFALADDPNTGRARAVEVRQEAFQLLDMGLQRAFLDGAIEIQAGGKNLFDIRALDSLFRASGQAHGERHVDWGRNYYLKMRLVWRP